MATPGENAALARLAKGFEHFADSDCEDPLYIAICRHVARSEALLQLMLAAPPEQRRPNLLLAAVHHRLLEERAAGAQHALAAYFPSVGGSRAPDAALAACFDDFVDGERGALLDRITRRATQTNETGRCAVVRPALRELAALSGRQRLALLDFGCSAGLNLGVDQWPIDYGDFMLGAAVQGGVPPLHCRLVGGGRPSPALAEPVIVSRLGIDLAPVDVQDDDAVRWLQACIWPHDRERMERLEHAIAVARRERWPVRRETDGVAAIARWLDTLPGDVQPVVMNSWVLAYFEPPDLASHVEGMLQLVRERGLAWLSGEGPQLRIAGAAAPPPPDGEAEILSNTLWTLAWRDAAGELRSEVLARSHPHGRWLQWIGLVR